MNMTCCAFKRRIDGHYATMVIDSGLTHDFVLEKIIKKLGISTTKSSDVLNVTLADRLSSSHLCR